MLRLACYWCGGNSYPYGGYCPVMCSFMTQNACSHLLDIMDQTVFLPINVCIAWIPWWKIEWHWTVHRHLQLVTQIPWIKPIYAESKYGFVGKKQCINIFIAQADDRPLITAAINTIKLVFLPKTHLGCCCAGFALIMLGVTLYKPGERQIFLFWWIGRLCLMVGDKW